MDKNDFNELIADVDKMAKRADSVLEKTHTVGLVDLSFDTIALINGEVKITVTSTISEMTPAQAKQVGWAIYWLGRYGEELESAEEHKLSRNDLSDDDFFRD